MTTIDNIMALAKEYRDAIDDHGTKRQALRAAIEQAIKDEREACAVAAEKQSRYIGYNAHAEAIAAAIRARKEKT